MKSDTDIFDATDVRHRLEKVGRSLWGEINILATPFVLLLRH